MLFNPNKILLLVLVLAIAMFTNVYAEGYKSATITFGGDVLLGGYYNSPSYGSMVLLTNRIERFLQHGGPECVADSLFSNIRSDFRDVDFSVVNLEGPITPELPQEDIEIRMEDKLIPVRQHEKTPEILKAAGVDLVSLANNHMFDYLYWTGLEYTIQLLKGKVDFVGAGFGEDAYKPAVKNINGINVSFFGISDILEPWDMFAYDRKLGIAGIPDTANYSTNIQMNMLLENIREAEMTSDFTVVILHAGPISGSELKERQLEIVDILLESGVDIVAGSHSHYTQPVKEIRNEHNHLQQIAFYGLGNLVFGGRQSFQAESMITTVTLHKPAIGEAHLEYLTKRISPNPDTTFTPVIISD
ncbi:MAG: CapA family protein [Calditrichaeota bacterium]|jgi:poly-gamma-glutamate capsule biosynthesis protein CapA/YwtB (metallophosphatase superfamily)|nr:CapA family protein [Calditrichota bacterium]MBT7617950.1 CapA family protein [Calditrichota bacterium]MBT7787249.1 CapA family protein [Calditrichota bacterium]